MIDPFATDDAIALDDDRFGPSKDTAAIEAVRAMGIDPRDPTDSPPGSRVKVAILEARYAAGVPLGHPYDRPRTIQ